MLKLWSFYGKTLGSIVPLGGKALKGVLSFLKYIVSDKVSFGLKENEFCLFRKKGVGRVCFLWEKGVGGFLFLSIWYKMPERG